MLAPDESKLKKRRQTAARVKRCDERKKNGLGSWRIDDLNIADVEIVLEEHGLLPCGVEHSNFEVASAIRKYLFLAITPQA
jgi:hypothetical protein